MPFVRLSILFSALILIFHTAISQDRPTTKVIVIGVDGMSPNGIEKADTPVMDSLCKIGSSSFQAQAVLPTSSSPNWASMIMGASPAEHGITSNSWKRKQIKDSVYCAGQTGETWPTMFRTLKEKYPKSRVGIFHHWLGFGRLVEGMGANVKRWTLTPKGTIGQAGNYLVSRKPDLLFIHMDHVDHAGHHFGHGTTEYFEAVAKADRLIGKLLKRLKKMKGGDAYTVIITADHGGIGKGHGGDTPEERTIPWIIFGKGVAKAKSIQSPIQTFDTAPTVLKIFGIPAPDCWIGSPVKEAFQK